MKIESSRPSPTVIVANVMLDKVGDSATFLLRSDAHHDAVAANQELEMRHLNEAVERDAVICDIGDLFDCMQGRYDKRSDRSALRPEYQHGPYLNRLVDVATERYRPFADRWLLMSRGNHETAIAKHNDFDLTEQLYSRLSTQSKILQLGSYSGYLCIRLNLPQKQLGTIRIAYHHGFGGSAPVTRGVIQSNRMAIAYPDADIVWSGHTHTEYYVTLARQRLLQNWTVERDEQTHIKSPGYKEDTLKGDGWAVEKGFMPGSLGAWWLRLWCESKTVTANKVKHRQYRVRYSLEAAK
jgi:hypothetical protein